MVKHPLQAQIFLSSSNLASTEQLLLDRPSAFVRWWMDSSESSVVSVCVSSAGPSGTNVCVPTRDTQNQRRYTFSSQHSQWEPSLASRVNTSNSCHTLLEPQSRWGTLLMLKVQIFCPLPVLSSLIGVTDVSGSFLECCLSSNVLLSFRLPLQKEWMPNRGWSLS